MTRRRMAAMNHELSLSWSCPCSLGGHDRRGDCDFNVVADIARHRWLYLGLLAALAIWCTIDVMPQGRVNTRRLHEHRTDFTVYTEAGAAFFDGRDPCRVTNPRRWRYLYPPLLAIVVSPLHELPPSGQVCIWYVLSVAMVLGCYIETRQLVASLDREGTSDKNHACLLRCAIKRHGRCFARRRLQWLRPPARASNRADTGTAWSCYLHNANRHPRETGRCKVP